MGDAGTDTIGPEGPNLTLPEEHPLLPRMSPPPESWAPARGAVRRLVRPIDGFLHTQASSGVLLILSALVAIV